jgi:hypothetical protein
VRNFIIAPFAPGVTVMKSRTIWWTRPEARMRKMRNKKEMLVRDLKVRYH